jgi:transcriptional regulator with XRE-family HTH domain
MTIINSNDRSSNIEYLAKNLTIAREVCGKTVKECGLLLDIPTSRLKNYEAGKYVPSLPEIEALSFLYRIPILAFFQQNAIENHLHTPGSVQIQRLVEIRQLIIGTRIHLAREKAKISMKQLSKTTSIPTSRIKRYEEGTKPIALDDLQKIIDALNLNLDDFFDRESPLGNWQNTQSKNIAFEHLPEEIKDFIADPNNLHYLKVAHNLSKIGMDTFINLSDSLAELTKTFQDPEKNID